MEPFEGVSMVLCDVSFTCFFPIVFGLVGNGGGGGGGGMED